MSSVEAAVETPDQVLVFALGDEDFCVGIKWVDEIVKEDEVSPVPDMPPMVEGMMDLRGQTTTIIDPKISFGIGQTKEDQQVIIFDTDDETNVGWLVDYAYRVETVQNPEVEPVEDNQYINGVLKDDGKFTLWVDPNNVNSQIT
jgi:purine-binding chemotaxis protein CheW